MILLPSPCSAASHLGGCLAGEILGAALWGVRPSGHAHEPKYSVIAFCSTYEELRVAGESDSISNEKHNVFKRKCNREVPEGQLGCLRAKWHPSLWTPCPQWLQAHPWQQAGYPAAWERRLRCEH